MLRITATFLLALFLFGGPASLLQTLAWSNMFIGFVAEDGVGLALEKTFDGEHECQICKFVKESEDELKANNPSSKKNTFEISSKQCAHSLQLEHHAQMPSTCCHQYVCMQWENIDLGPPVPPPQQNFPS